MSTKEKIQDTVIGILTAGVIYGAVSLWVDVDRLKASESNNKDDIHDIKKDVKDIHKYLLGAK
jgi:hypothetical protein